MPLSLCTFSFSNLQNNRCSKICNLNFYFGAGKRHVFLHVYTPIKTRALLDIVNINKGATQLYLCQSLIFALLVAETPFYASNIDEKHSTMRLPTIFLAVTLAVIFITAAPASGSLYCGTNYADSLKCVTACPGGVDGECPSGEKCFRDVPCRASNPVAPVQGSGSLYCGTNYSDSFKCLTACPGGIDGECPSGEKCFRDVQCSVSN